MKKWLAKVMVGRYGVDQLTNALLTASMVLLVLSLFFGTSMANTVLWLIALALLGIGYFRISPRKRASVFRKTKSTFAVTTA